MERRVNIVKCKVVLTYLNKQNFGLDILIKGSYVFVIRSGILNVNHYLCCFVTDICRGIEIVLFHGKNKDSTTPGVRNYIIVLFIF